jgi:hypothetical protein
MAAARYSDIVVVKRMDKDPEQIARGQAAVRVSMRRLDAENAALAMKSFAPRDIGDLTANERDEPAYRLTSSYPHRASAAAVEQLDRRGVPASDAAEPGIKWRPRGPRIRSRRRPGDLPVGIIRPILAGCLPSMRRPPERSAMPLSRAASYPQWLSCVADFH